MDQSRDLLSSFPRNTLYPGNSLYSATRAFRLTLQATDGNLVLGVLDDRSIPPDSIDGGQYPPIWDAGISLATAVVYSVNAIMQDDGNFVVYAQFTPEGVQPVWDTGTNGNPGAFLRCQDDGNLVLYSQNGAPLWATFTQAGKR